MRTADTRGARDWALLLGLGAAGLALVAVVFAQPMLSTTTNWALDWDAYQVSSLRLGQEGTLYATASLRSSFEPVDGCYYLYTPPFGIAFGLLAWLPADVGATVWYYLHLAVLALSCALMPIRIPLRFWTFAIAVVSVPVISDFILGNVSSVMLLPVVIGWRWLDRPAGSLALAIATSVKATFGLYLIWFAVRRAWRPLAWIVAGGVALIVLSLPFVGIDGYRDYFTMLGNINAPADLLPNRHVNAMVLSWGFDESAAWAAQMAVYLAAVGAMLLSLRRDREVGYMVILAATIVLAPLLWGHYLSLLVVPAAFLAQRGRPWALLLPLLAWMPEMYLSLLALAALWLPFLARDREEDSHDSADEPEATAMPAPSAGA